MRAYLTDGGIEIPDLDEKFERLEGILTGRGIYERANYSLEAACEIKGVVYKTAKSDPLMQPQLGYSRRRFGRKRYFSREAVERWLEVFEDDVPAYIVELLGSEDEDLRLGVQARIVSLRQSGKFPEAIWRDIRDFIDIKGVA